MRTFSGHIHMRLAGEQKKLGEFLCPFWQVFRSNSGYSSRMFAWAMGLPLFSPPGVESEQGLVCQLVVGMRLFLPK